MLEPIPQWQMCQSDVTVPLDWVETVRQCCPAAATLPLHATAQLLWQRGIRQLDMLRGFLNVADYKPADPLAFGEEMSWAVTRFKRAYTRREKVAIWGDFDADGVTATSVLWEGLTPLFASDDLCYYIPNRFTESHGLSRSGLEHLAAWGCQLLVTCDTGSTSLSELEYAQTLGIDVIVTDHHTLPVQRPPVVAIINPRSLPLGHPLQTLSGVAVAYKLLEGLYPALDLPTDKLDSLLDLVAIGLIADLVELRGDCRYLAQRGLTQLQSHTQTGTAAAQRPGVARLLELCKRTGDRPTDISFGIGPRINAISRIHGDARFCVELLTSQDVERCNTLALEAELANSRRKALQRELLSQVRERIAQLDLATTEVIVLADEQWPAGILGLVAGQVVQQYGRPTLLLALDPIPSDGADHTRLASGSARSLPGLDLYELFHAQAHLLRGYGGHPLAAGLNLPAENLPLLTDALNRQVRELKGETVPGPVLAIDLTVTVAELGQTLFRELKLLEPYGMGNPVPRLLIRNCWFARAWHRSIKDQRGGKVAFIRTEFELWDDTVQLGFSGEWWDHYADDLPKGRCDVVVELDFNTVQKQYLVRLISLRPALPTELTDSNQNQSAPILDWRQQRPDSSLEALLVTECPADWSEWQQWRKQATVLQKPLAIAYPPPAEQSPQAAWKHLVGLAKYLSRTGATVSTQQLQEKLGLSAHAVELGLNSLETLGFRVQAIADSVQIELPDLADPLNQPSSEVVAFLEAVQEEAFRRRYFYQVPLATLEAAV
ncbi:MAG TPA: single-stranded-DNA-specific exonuclease RecJ [Leptolyngbyaceae cyanobacterium]